MNRLPAGSYSVCEARCEKAHLGNIISTVTARGVQFFPHVRAELPGVAKDGLEITAEESQLRIVGRRAWKEPEGWTALYRESTDALYELVLAHDNAIALEKIRAELADGVLRASLPKAEAVKPRKIAVS